jgi:uncharacterized protein YjbI with pentapeptide repeats
VVKFALHLEDLYKYDACEEDIELFLYLAATQGSKNKLILSKYELMWLCCDSTTSLFNLAYSELRQVDLTGAYLAHANLSNTKLVDVDLTYTNLQGVNFKNSYLEDVNFERALRHREDSPIPRWKVNNNGVLQRD